MIEQPARGLRAPVPFAGGHGHLDGRSIWRRIRVDQTQGLVARVQDLHAADDDALKWIPADGWKAGLPGGLAGERRQSVRVERVAGQRTDQIWTALQAGVERLGVRDLLLDEMPLELRRVDVEAGRRHDASRVERILLGVSQRDEDIRPFQIRARQRGGPPDGLPGGIAGPAQLIDQGGQIASGRHPVEPADAHVDGVDLPSPEFANDGVAGLLEPQAAQDVRAVIGRHPDGVGIAEEVRGVQEVDVQGVAFDPLAAVEQPAQDAQRAVHRHAGGALDGVHALIW